MNKTLSGCSHAHRLWTIDCGSRYWQKSMQGENSIARQKIAALPIVANSEVLGIEANLLNVRLPDWAKDIGVNGSLLAFAECINTGDGPEWKRCDWLSVAFHMLASTPERIHEAANGPSLSYAFRLSPRMEPLFERAWVNRIFLFLRRWAAHEAGSAEETLFGPLPEAQIILTHDLDAIRLTPEIRLKQAVFQTVNAVRAVAMANSAAALRRVNDAGRYLFSCGDFRTLGRLREMERAAGLKSIMHVYGGRAGLKRGSVRRILIDPSYDVMSIADELRKFRDEGHEVGLHQSFDAWQSATAMRVEKHRVEQALGSPITHCRQHWLHFSFSKTWIAQNEAGLTFDSTLGFNDRAGFRASHALSITPPPSTLEVNPSIKTVPLILMDSHVYDYAGVDRASPEKAIKPWLDEVRAVRGIASVNWHPHTITPIYGWGSGFEALLEQLS